MYKNVSTLGKLGRFYKRMLCKHPILVQGTQTALLMGVADVIAQKAVEKKCGWDHVRTAQFASLGFLVVGPALTLWYKTLARLVRGCGPSAALKKMALDQILFAPAFLAFFLVVLSALHGKCWEEIKQELECKYTDVLMANYKIWPAVQMANFTFVPLNYQVLLVQTVALFWNTYLSWKSQLDLGESSSAVHKDKALPRPEPEEAAPDEAESEEDDDDCK